MTSLTHHGGRLDAAARLYPHAPRPWLDLSTGINPVAWQPPADLAVDWRALPSIDGLAALEASAAAAFGTAVETVVAVPGTEIALRLLAHLDLPKPFRYLAPTYRTHGEAVPGAIAVAHGAAVPAGGTLLLANPNNPDGRVLDHAALHALSDGRRLIVDEAFADGDPAISIVPARPPETIVLRSFGKFFGLAGVRLGFVIGPPDVVAAVRGVLGDWPVSAAAIAFGTAAYRDARWITETRARLPADCTALDAMLRRHGLSPRGGCPLFRLVERDPTPFERLARGGILTRPFDYAPGWLRIGLPPDAAALERLDRALAGHGG